jgi:DNA-binding MarR family transcriptional regulator
VGKKLIRRVRSTVDRREVRVSLTPAGRNLVEQVTVRRREELSRLVDAMPQTWYRPVTEALHSLATSVGEVPEREWWLGWAATADAPTD